MIRLTDTALFLLGEATFAWAAHLDVFIPWLAATVAATCAVHLYRRVSARLGR